MNFLAFFPIALGWDCKFRHKRFPLLLHRHFSLHFVPFQVHRERRITSNHLSIHTRGHLQRIALHRGKLQLFISIFLPCFLPLAVRWDNCPLYDRLSTVLLMHHFPVPLQISLPNNQEWFLLYEHDYVMIKR